MSDDDKHKIEVRIMGKLYPVACPQHQKERLREAVSLLNNRAEKLKRGITDAKYSDITWNRDSILAIVALNLSYELLKMHTDASNKALEYENLVARIKDSFSQPHTDDPKLKISEMSL